MVSHKSSTLLASYFSYRVLTTLLTYSSTKRRHGPGPVPKVSTTKDVGEQVETSGHEVPVPVCPEVVDVAPDCGDSDVGFDRKFSPATLPGPGSEISHLYCHNTPCLSDTGHVVSSGCRVDLLWTSLVA